MYNYLLNQWIDRKVTSDYIQARNPKYLTQSQVDIILATPQKEEVIL